MPLVAGSRPDTPIKVVSVFGTRPEIIKFLPVLRELGARSGVACINVLTSQHVDLVRPLVEQWAIPVHHDLNAMVSGQSLNNLVSRLVARLDEVLRDEVPDMVLVQGDTATAFAAALAAWHRKVPVGHIEAGLRSSHRESPFPEEMNRRLVTHLASLHFAPTERNVATLRAEGVPKECIVCTGNPIVDAIELIRGREAPSPATQALLDGLVGRRMILLTTHRRESFGEVMRDRLGVLRQFVTDRPDVALLFPVHPNPAVQTLAAEVLGGVPQIHLLPPLPYADFLYCLAASWLVVSDSGGVQEEAPSLGKPLLVIRSNTERPEVVEAGIAHLVGESAEQLRCALVEAEGPTSWASRVGPVANPFGQGDSAVRIADAVLAWAGQRATEAERPELEATR